MHKKGNAAVDPAAALKTDLLRVSFIMVYLLILVGPITGPQQVFRAVGKRGIFADRCSSEVHDAKANFTRNTNYIIAHAPAGKNLTALGVYAASPDVVISMPCEKQEDAIEWAADLFLSISNFVCIVNGVLVDLLGAYRMAVVGTFVWAIAKSCAGLAPGSGIVWIACQSISAIVGLGSFMAVGLVHLKHACPNPVNYAFWCFLASAFWDIAVMINIPLSYFYEWERLTIGECYAIYGLCVGVPFFLGMMTLFRGMDAAGASAAEGAAHSGDKEASATCESLPAIRAPARNGDMLINESSSLLRHEETIAGGGKFVAAKAPHATATTAATNGVDVDAGGDDRDIESATAGIVDSADGLTGIARVRHVMIAAKAIVVSPIYWMFVAHCCVTVSIGYYLISNVATVARHIGTTESQAHDTHLITTFMMSGIGLLNVVPGKLLQSFGTRRGLVLCLAIEVMWLVVTCASLCFRRGVVPLYVGYTAMMTWRVWGFGLCTPFLSWRFYRHRSSIGFAYGLAFTVAGAVSAGWGTAAHQAMRADSSKYFAPIVIGSMVGCAVLQSGFALCIARATDVDPTEELQQAAVRRNSQRINDSCSDTSDSSS